MNAQTKRRIEATAAYMKQHMHETITREALAELAGMTPEHYSRLFRKCTGQSPIDYLTGLRMERAKHLMRDSGHPIVAIARQVGFSDPYYFSRRFRQVFGQAPSDYRASPRQRIVALDYYEYFRLLGTSPVGTDGGGVSGFFADWTSRTTAVTGRDRMPDLERIRSLKPDLIVTAREELEPALSAIAPTKVLPMEKDPVGEQLPAIAELVGKQDEAAAWSAQYNREADELRARLYTGGPAPSAAVLRIRDCWLQMYGTMNMGYPLYRALRMSPPERIRLQTLCNRHFHSSLIAPEELPYYACDHLFIVLQPDRASRIAWEKLRATEAWRQHPAVQAGRVYEVDVRRWLAYDPFSIQGQMNEAAALMLGEHQQHSSAVFAHKNPS